jgi:hypothetical protein
LSHAIQILQWDHSQEFKQWLQGSFFVVQWLSMLTVKWSGMMFLFGNRNSWRHFWIWRKCIKSECVLCCSVGEALWPFIFYGRYNHMWFSANHVYLIASAQIVRATLSSNKMGTFTLMSGTTWMCIFPEMDWLCRSEWLIVEMAGKIDRPYSMWLPLLRVYNIQCSACLFCSFCPSWGNRIAANVASITGNTAQGFGWVRSSDICCVTHEVHSKSVWGVCKTLRVSVLTDVVVKFWVQCTCFLCHFENVKFLYAYSVICSSRLTTYSLPVTNRQNANHCTSSEISKQHRVKYWDTQLITVSYSYWVLFRCASRWAVYTGVLTVLKYVIVQWDHCHILLPVHLLVLLAEMAGLYFCWT